MNHLLLALAASWIIASASPAFAATLVLNPLADTMIRDTEDKPPGDGATVDVACGTTRQGQQARVLTRFDITGLPPNATVTNASLRLVVNQSPADGLTAPFSLHRMYLHWGEFAASWDATGFGDWYTPGGASGIDFAAASSGTANVSGTGPVLFTGAGLLSDVLMWLTNSATNSGWMLLCDSAELQTAKRFDTREHPDPTVRPQLLLDYSAPLTLLNPRITAGEFAFDFVASAGTNYMVQYKDSLSTNWLDYLYFADPGQDATNTVTDSGGVHRFFRVAKSP